MFQGLMKVENMHQQIPLFNENLRFNSLAMCDAFKNEYGDFISEIENAVIQSNDSVIYSETWLCGKAASVVVGFDENDEIVVQENLGIKLIEAIQ